MVNALKKNLLKLICTERKTLFLNQDLILNLSYKLTVIGELCSSKNSCSKKKWRIYKD